VFRDLGVGPPVPGQQDDGAPDHYASGGGGAANPLEKGGSIGRIDDEKPGTRDRDVVRRRV
jgi:hypothetical protein